MYSSCPRIASEYISPAINYYINFNCFSSFCLLLLRLRLTYWDEVNNPDVCQVCPMEVKKCAMLVAMLTHV